METEDGRERGAGCGPGMADISEEPTAAARRDEAALGDRPRVKAALLAAVASDDLDKAVDLLFDVAHKGFPTSAWRDFYWELRRLGDGFEVEPAAARFALAVMETECLHIPLIVELAKLSGGANGDADLNAARAICRSFARRCAEVGAIHEDGFGAMFRELGQGAMFAQAIQKRRAERERAELDAAVSDALRVAASDGARL